jgi:DUF1680 family protein
LTLRSGWFDSLQFNFAMIHRLCPSAVFILVVSSAAAAPVAEKGPLALQSLPAARFQFSGVVGERIAGNIEGWLLAAPRTNPGMLEMFRVRDRQPTPQLVPWAGEFAGKYLLSCVAALRQSEREDLHKHTAAFVAELIATQAEDGYLGPFPKDRRLLGEWDLWGHYHIMQGLLEWMVYACDPAPIDCVRRAADLICSTYLDGTRRVFDAGSQEMNMAISHVMAELHRRTGEPRYLELVRQIEKDWERAGDYLRTGVDGVPFYKTPKPRWESLHDLQTLVELWRITGEAKYRDAFISHWRTIREFDIRNSGAFSGGEQATGNSYAPTPIETCCTVAWMALSVDMLRLTGDIAAAEELERATFNGALGSQHPGGRWWTYNTPMDGDRKSSAHDIVFQARAGTPELNCCSVNGPRTPGMLADWAVMRDEAGLVINTHAPVSAKLPGDVTVVCESRYPMDGRITWRITAPEKLRVKFRIPSWAVGATAAVAGSPLEVKPGSYCEVERTWTAADNVVFEFPMKLRSVDGQREQAGRISVYRGPLLLAWDQRDNDHDEFRVPRLTPELLQTATRTEPSDAGLTAVAPWILLEIPVSGKTVRLRDFATAGMNGTRYRSWLRGGSAAPANAGAPPVLHELKEEVKLNGRDEMRTFPLPDGFMRDDCTVSVRVQVHEMPDKRIAQVFSAWCAVGDDPLRLVVENGRLFARIEGGRDAATSGVPLTIGTWHHVAAVKEADVLTLFLDGQPVASAGMPEKLKSKSKLCAVGGNPLYKGSSEFLAASFRDLMIWNRALADEEVGAGRETVMATLKPA